MNEAQSAFDTASTLIAEDNRTIILWEDLKTSTITGNSEEIQRISQELSNTYKDESGKQIGTLAEQVSKETDLAKERAKVWEENGIEINDTRKKQLEIGIRTVAEKLVEQTNTVKTLSEDEIKAWQALAEGSEQIYNEQISKVNDDIRLALETMMNTTTSLTPIQIEQWANLARNDKSAYENNLTGLDETTRQRVQSCVNAVNNEHWSAEEASKGLAKAVERGVNTIDTTEAGRQAVNGVTKGINNNKNSKSLWQAIGGVVDNVKGWFKQKLGINSPSKVMAKLSSSIPEGIVKGINNNSNIVKKPVLDLAKQITNSFEDNISISDVVKDISKGFTVNPQDFEIDTNQFIDYGQISGAIATQNNVSVSSDIDSRIENAIYRGLSNATIPVEIEATTDEGVIFKKIQVQAREFTMQTGEPAFEI